MAKVVLLHPGERVDLIDLQYGLSEYPIEQQKGLLDSIYGSGVLDGFRVRIVDATRGIIEISNGRAISGVGSFLNAETGSIGEEVVLTRASTEYWIEVELIYIDTDVDSRAFFDPLVENVSPIPHGQEVNVSRVMTRKVPAWRVRRPIRNNSTGVRGQTGYSAAQFSPASDDVVSIAVIRTNSSGVITVGDANSSAEGNHLVSYTVEGGATHQMVRPRGYGELGTISQDVNGNDVVYGFKTTDQRSRFFEPVLPPFTYGKSGEVIGALSVHDGWGRDVKSMLDHVCSEIAQIKLGSASGRLGVEHEAFMSSMSLDATEVVLSNIIDNGTPAGSVASDEDQFMGATFQILDSHWGGFYARIKGNKKVNGSGETVLSLEKTSSFPNWMPLPDFTQGPYACKIIQYRQRSWLEKATPARNYLGLNDLDSEVVAARSDWASGVDFKLLGSRLNANKLSTITFAPPPTNGVDSGTGEPIAASDPRADVFESLSEIRTAMSNIASTGGLVHFRAGLYDFSGQSPIIDKVFSFNQVAGLVFEGEGRGKTILKNSDLSNIFNFNSCSDITFKNMSIQSTGTPVLFSSCSNVQFINCDITGYYADTSTPTLSLGNAQNFLFDNCVILVTGSGIEASQWNSCVMRDSKVGVSSPVPEEISYLMTLGSCSKSRIYNTIFNGNLQFSAIQWSYMEDCHFYDLTFNTSVNIVNGSGVSIGALVVLGDVKNSVLEHWIFNDVTGSTKTGYIFFASSFENSFVNNISSLEKSVTGVEVSGNITNSHLINCDFVCLEDGFGIKVDGSLVSSVVDGHYVTADASNVTLMDITGSVTESSIQNNNGKGDSGNLAYGIVVKNDINNSIIGKNKLNRVSQVGIYLYSTGSSVININNSIIDDNIMRGYEVSANQGILLSSVTLKGVSISGNHVSNAQTCIDLDVVDRSEGLVMKKNQTSDAVGVAYKFDFRTFIRKFIFSQNTNRDPGNNSLGCTIEMPSCVGEMVSFSDNMIASKGRAFEIWSDSGASSLSKSFICENSFLSNGEVGMVIGAAESNGALSLLAIAGSSPFNISGCIIKDNQLKAENSSPGVMWLAEVNGSIVESNQCPDSVTDFGITVAGACDDVQILKNQINVLGSNGVGISCEGNCYDFIIGDNSISVNGDSGKGINLSHNTVTNFSLIKNRIYVNGISGVGIWTDNSVAYFDITNNRIDCVGNNNGKGIRLAANSIDGLLGGNRLRVWGENVIGLYCPLASGLNVINNHIDGNSSLSDSSVACDLSDLTSSVVNGNLVRYWNRGYTMGASSKNMISGNYLSWIRDTGVGNPVFFSFDNSATDNKGGNLSTGNDVAYGDENGGVRVGNSISKFNLGFTV